ncbi:MAG: T9SS type A sorting domain-containing protein, partial [Candidatus Marinimicrobia bacterium]|nr:T9SS type A sorting domain-containing protein [Candidatus Neomarinimicrobiota bacterium]
SAGELLVGLSAGDNTRTASGFLVVVRQQQEAALGVEERAGLPAAFALHQNYPNPFNPATTIRFDLPLATDIHIVVYDLLGRKVVRLLNQHLEPGFHELLWNGRDRTGRELPTGMYIVLLATPQFSKSIKMILLK